MPKKLDLTENLEKYIIDHSEPLTDVQKEIIQYNISLGDQQRLQISVSQAQFLQTLIKISNNLILLSANGTLSSAPGASSFLWIDFAISISGEIITSMGKFSLLYTLVNFGFK